MIKATRKTSTYDWLRAYTALSRSGYVTDAIRACEAAWAESLEGNPEAVEAIRRLPEYESYIKALRSLLHFPLTLYRATTQERYGRWQVENYSRPVATSFSEECARVIHEVYPEAPGPIVLITGSVTEPEAVIMRGRIEMYELVMDSGRVSPTNVRLLDE